MPRLSCLGMRSGWTRAPVNPEAGPGMPRSGSIRSISICCRPCTANFAPDRAVGACDLPLQCAEGLRDVIASLLPAPGHAWLSWP
jgi:hypothetical protein